MKCQNCGNELSDDAKFCSNCGFRLPKENDSFPQQETEKTYIQEESGQDNCETATANQTCGKTMGDKIKDSMVSFWNSLDRFNKTATVGIGVVVLLLLVSICAKRVFAIFISVVQLSGFIIAILMHKKIINIPQKEKLVKCLVMVAAILLTVFNIMSYSWNTGNSDLVDKTSPSLSDEEIVSTTASVTAVTPWGGIDCVGQEYSAVQEDFITAGFTNVKAQSLEELTLADTDKLHTISSVTVSGNNEFAKGEEIEKDQEIIITYYAYQKYNVKICVDFEGNWFFSTYDVNLLIDGLNKGTLSHGTDQEFSENIDPGEYTITFENVDNSSVSGQVTLMVDCNIVAEYRISCQSDKINVETVYVDRLVELADGEIKIDTAAEKYKGTNYAETDAALKEIGFTNIKHKVLYDIESEWTLTSNGDVESISIGGKTDFKRGDIFDSATEIVITYHAYALTSEQLNEKINNRYGTPASEIISDLDGTGYTVVCLVQGEEVSNFDPEGYIFDHGSIDSSNKTIQLNFITQAMIEASDKLEEFIPRDTAERVAVVAMTNGQATDVFHSDRTTYDISKFHKYSDLSGFYLSVVSGGQWTAKNEETWHVSGMKFMMSGWTTYLKASMDITFDGTNYLVSNVDRTTASEDYIDSDDTSKIYTDHIEPSESTPFLTVAPNMVEADRDSEAEIAQNNKTMPTTTRTNWIENQFSFWNGEHKTLKDLIKKNLNDESSYDHISTNYVDVTSAEMAELVNDALRSDGFSQRVEIGDLFITCEFSAKNVFNATIKNTAYAIVHFDEDTVELIAIQ